MPYLFYDTLGDLSIPYFKGIRTSLLIKNRECIIGRRKEGLDEVCTRRHSVITEKNHVALRTPQVSLYSGSNISVTVSMTVRQGEPGVFLSVQN